MSQTKESIDSLIKKNNIKFIDLRFTDTIGVEQHITIPISAFDDVLLKEGKMFDGSSIEGWQAIHQSDLSLKPDLNTAFIDPFYTHPTLNITCDVYDPITNLGYERSPRSIAKKAQEYLKSTGIADTCYFGPEPEFFIFDDVKFKTDHSGSSYSIDSNEAIWNSNKHIETGNLAHRPGIKGGYFPLPPMDSSQNIRAKICLTLEKIGQTVEAHHHEVATCNQNEIATQYNQLLNKADETQVLKYVVKNIACQEGKTATFMPKPLVGDNGSGMHCHQSLSKEGVNIFYGDEYANLSLEALYYIGGIIKHAKSLNAFTNPGTNSYKRLVPGFEAPVLLSYSARNRSAAIRVPHSNGAKAKRIEVRFPDPLANPYLAFSAMLLAGLDGIKNKIHPGEAIEKDLYELDDIEQNEIPSVAYSLEEALHSLEQDMDYLLVDNVFTKSFIKSYIEIKKKDINKLRLTTHPLEFDMYYSL